MFCKENVSRLEKKKWRKAPNTDVVSAEDGSTSDNAVIYHRPDDLRQGKTRTTTTHLFLSEKSQ